MKISAIICAAGKGERAGFGKNKLLAPLHGAPALWHTLKKFNMPEISEVIVTSSADDFEEISALASPFGFKVVVGGQTRTESVKKALDSVTGDIVLIHDGARPYLTKKLILDCIEGVKKNRSAICAVNATDTVVYADENKRLDRNKVFLIQTPQGFYTNDIKKAYALAGNNSYTDDSAVYGAFIAAPVLIDGEAANKKLTYKTDFDTPLLPAYSSGRVGFGIDVHMFGEGTFVTLGGVKIDCDRKLIAHSDGDVLIHAVMDALLSAGGLNDIGHYFPDTDDRYKNADSLEMLKQVVKILKQKGYAPLNISASLQAEKPKLKNHISDIKKNLASVLGISEDDIAVGAGTCEGLGFVGEKLGICAYAIATLKEV
ncbi:MAG: 2-C-methyl-D-erythritol 2,4-cyclodiphosphate synthase [Clostridia bacterium]|nr:2-C-methyl-D-erythritol 2,4-cyclodiphosphate synthase [Clostridia bacterium]